MRIFQIQQFSYDRDSKTFSAEASSLGIPPGASGGAGSLFGTSFKIHNMRTGNTVRFEWSGIKADREGDVEYEVFAAVSGPDAFQVHIFND